MGSPATDTIDLSQIEAILANLTSDAKANLRKTVAHHLDSPFLPNPGPQTAALNSKADLLLYGGAAGGGKSALEIGAFFREHYSGIVLRREGTQLDGLIEFCKEVGEPDTGHFVGGQISTFRRKDGGTLKFAGLRMPDDWRKYAGIGRDFMAFDEAGEFLADQVFSLIGWLRSTREGQRCRAILGSNPPRGGDGEWMIEEFAPWLDDNFDNPAADGELRWAIRVGGITEWVDGPGHYERGGEDYEALSRTFISARLDDNPYLTGTNYRAVLQGLPEPLRSQLLYGDFLAGREDHQWQIIPTEWVTAAQERWRKAEQKYRRMFAVSADIAMGGKDKLAIQSLHSGNWFSEIDTYPGADVKDPIFVTGKMLEKRKDDADISVDNTGGWGTGVKSNLNNAHKVDCFPIVYSEGSGGASKGGMRYKNVRAEMYWNFREALDPDQTDHDPLMLPPDSGLKAQLTGIRWFPPKTDMIQVESKEEYIKRAGASPDKADVCVQLWHRRHAAGYRAAVNDGTIGNDDYSGEPDLDDF